MTESIELPRPSTPRTHLAPRGAAVQAAPVPHPAQVAQDRALVLALSDPAANQAALSGGKAVGLVELLAAGLPVPAGFVVTTAAFRLGLQAAGIEAPGTGGGVFGAAGAAAAAGPEPGLDAEEQALGRARERLLAAPWPAALAEAVCAAYATLAGGEPDCPVAVRSSGTREDLAEASFAGQYETVLDVRGEAALLDAVRQCWASAYTPRVLHYLRHQDGDGGALELGVVVQRLVDARAAGVLFTVNPLTGREEEMMVEAVLGLGEALVAGRAAADRFVVAAEGGTTLRQEIVRKTSRLVPRRGPDGAARPGAPADDDGRATTWEQPLDERSASEPALQEAQLRTLAELGAAAQEHFGRPLDIEWAVDGEGRMQLLQARPITRLAFDPALGEWTTADFKDGGVSSDVCPPLMASLYEQAFEGSMPPYLKDIKLLATADATRWYRTFFARPYWNLGKIKEVMRQVPGFNERHFDLDLGVTPTYDGDGHVTPTTVGGVLRALPVLFALRRNYVTRLARDERFAAAFAERTAPFELEAGALAALPEPEFVRRYGELVGELYVETETSYFSTIYNTSNAMLDFKVQLGRADRVAGRAHDALALVGGLVDLAHLRPVQELHELCGRLQRTGGAPPDEATLRAFAHRWRHKSRKELDLRMPRWDEDLEHVREQLTQGLAGWSEAQDPASATRRQHDAYLAERARIERALRWRPWLRRSFGVALDRLRRYAWWREEMRDLSSRVYALIRRWTLEAGRRLQAAGRLAEVEQVWYLTVQQLRGALAHELDDAQLARLLARGERLLRSFRNFANPNELGGGHRFEGERPAPLPLPGAQRLQGTAASFGRVEGTARVVRTLAESGKFQRGDILVTTFTDPGWTPLMALAAGIVTETGGVLCHAAVISREYGIPAVLALAGATRAIPDGARIVLDGATGTVDLLPPA